MRVPPCGPPRLFRDSALPLLPSKAHERKLRCSKHIMCVDLLGGSLFHFPGHAAIRLLEDKRSGCSVYRPAHSRPIGVLRSARRAKRQREKAAHPARQQTAHHHRIPYRTLCWIHHLSPRATCSRPDSKPANNTCVCVCVPCCASAPGPDASAHRCSASPAGRLLRRLLRLFFAGLREGSSQAGAHHRHPKDIPID